MSADVESSSRARQLVVNGESRETAAPSLAALLEELGYAGQKVATALNGNFVAERTRVGTELRPGDHVEIVAPRQGG